MNMSIYKRRYADERYLEVAERFCEYARGEGLHPATLAVAWVKAHPAVTAPILGARNVEQLEPSLAAADLDLSPDQWNEIAALGDPPPVATDRTEERDRH